MRNRSIIIINGYLLTLNSSIATNLMRYFFCGLLFFVSALTAFSQKQVKGVVADSISHKALPFATVKADGKQNVFITGINGRFSLSLTENTKQLVVSYISYNTKTISAGLLKDNDTIFLSPAMATLGEVIVKPQNDKVKRIINAAVRNKPLHNPEMYDLYECNVYYKMKADMLPQQVTDSAWLKRREKLNEKRNKKDTTQVEDGGGMVNGMNNHVAFSESYSKRMYKRPQQLQEIVLASRFSGLKKTYFTNLVTNILPFHVYSDYIQLNGKDYVNPVSKGWQQRYNFFLADEIINGNDTTFMFSFDPKSKVGFNSLSGMIYINSDGYAISHFISSVGDTATTNREIRIEQVYDRVGGKWFPKELNYDLIYKQYILKGVGFKMNGHSVIDSVSFTPGPGFKIEKAYSVKLSDSVDLRSEKDWEKMRTDTITTKEKNTYHIVDSIFEKRKVESFIAGMGKLVIGRFPYKIFDIDIARVLATNDYEDTRVGLGLYTNEKVSKYFSIGGWAGYGVQDKKTKYGFSFTGFAKGNKDNWLRLFYSDDYQNAGNVHIHPEIDRNGYRTWLLTTPDRVREYGATAHTQRGYWEIELDGRKQKLSALYANNFTSGGKSYNEFDVKEASIGLRYAYGEKREPAFGYYFPAGTKYPIVYFRAGLGEAKSGNDYSLKYFRALVAVNFAKHINRWGNEDFRLEAGFIHSFNDAPFSRSFLLASKGFRRDGINYYTAGGFLTMRPFDYYSDSYISFLYKHDFDKYLWKSKISKPFVSIAHNLLYGNMRSENKIANVGIAAPVSGYHESGILLNQLLQKDLFHTTFIYLNAGAFYHWTPSFNWKKNGVFVVGLSAGF